MNADNERLRLDQDTTDDLAESQDRAPAGNTDDGEKTTSTQNLNDTASAEQKPWRKEIRPYLKKLAERVAADGVKDNSISLSMGQNRILISPREQRLMLAFSEGPGEPEVHDGMLVDSLGLQVRMLASLRNMARDDDLNVERHRRRVARERDFAYVLSREMTITMRLLSESGEHDEMEALQESRSHLHKAIVEVENVFGTQLTKAPKLSRKSKFVYDWKEIASSPNVTPPNWTPPSIDVKSAAAKHIPKDRRLWLRVILVVLCLVLMAVLLNLWVNRQRRLPDFTVQDFIEVPGIEQVVNRSPLLLIVVNQCEWKQLNAFEKHKAVEAVGTVAKTAGYQKVEFRSTETYDLAVWHRSGTIKIAK